ncbi:MAG: NAD(P)H-dependent oxidoreductase [Caldilineaceae bacterium]
MLDVLTIAGCSSPTSSSTALLHYVRQKLIQQNLRVGEIEVRHLPADDLLLGMKYSPALRQGCDLVRQAAAVVIATPIRNRSLSGGLKAFLDILPQDALVDKLVLPIATSSVAINLAHVDAAMRLILSSLGARQIFDVVQVLDHQVQLYDRQVHLDPFARQSLDESVRNLVDDLSSKPSTVHRLVGDSFPEFLAFN